jgi:hypothetical protein
VELAKQKTMSAKTTRQAGGITSLLAIAVCGALQVRAQSNLPTEVKRQTHPAQPMIPGLAKKTHLTGAVRIEVTIAPGGTVKRSRVFGGASAAGD